jgi:hypothetical protein
MNEREWMRIAGEALQSLKRIEKTVSEPQTLSAHRIAANRKISKAMDYIARLETEIDEDTPIIRELMATSPKTILKDIRNILTNCGRE